MERIASGKAGTVQKGGVGMFLEDFTQNHKLLVTLDEMSGYGQRATRSHLLKQSDTY